MDEEKFWTLVSLMLSGEATTGELEQLDTYVSEHPDVRQRLQAVKSIWENKQTQAATDASFDRHLQRLSNHLAPPVLKYNVGEQGSREPISSKRTLLRKSMIFASAIAASIFICMMLVYRTDPPKLSSDKAPQNIVSTKPGSRSKIELPDGTQVWLNADSRLEYDDKFTQGVRSVHLSGEAYFDVAKDKDHPFIIHTSTIDIRVLGTAFNVRSYQNESNTETALIRGSVEIIAHNDPERRIILKPLEKLVISNMPPETVSKAEPEKAGQQEKPLVMISQVHIEKRDSAAKDILWTRNKLSFDSEPLENVALKLERWFNVKVKITDDRLRGKSYTAVFEYENLKQVMEALQLTGNFTYAINKNEVTIKP